MSTLSVLFLLSSPAQACEAIDHEIGNFLGDPGAVPVNARLAVDILPGTGEVDATASLFGPDGAVEGFAQQRVYAAPDVGGSGGQVVFYPDEDLPPGDYVLSVVSGEDVRDLSLTVVDAFAEGLDPERSPTLEVSYLSEPTDLDLFCSVDTYREVGLDLRRPQYGPGGVLLVYEVIPGGAAEGGIRVDEAGDLVHVVEPENEWEGAFLYSPTVDREPCYYLVYEGIGGHQTASETVCGGPEDHHALVCGTGCSTVGGGAVGGLGWLAGLLALCRRRSDSAEI